MNDSPNHDVVILGKAVQLSGSRKTVFSCRIRGRTWSSSTNWQGNRFLSEAVIRKRFRIWAEKSLKSDQVFAQAKGYAVLAMAQWQLGQKEKARAMLAGGDSLAPHISSAQHTVDLGDSWLAWLFARISLDEGGQLIPLDAETK